MLDIKTVILIFVTVFLLLVLTQRVIRNQKKQVSGQTTNKPSEMVAKPRMTEEQFNKSWKSLSYLMLFAAAGNLYMAYNSLRMALDTQSYILWMDTVFSLAAAFLAVLIWRLHRRILVIVYLILTVLPIMVFLSTGHSLDGLLHIFPLMLVYFAVKPVWDYLD